MGLTLLLWECKQGKGVFKICIRIKWCSFRLPFFWCINCAFCCC